MVSNIGRYSGFCLLGDAVVHGRIILKSMITAFLDLTPCSLVFTYCVQGRKPYYDYLNYSYHNHRISVLAPSLSPQVRPSATLLPIYR
jgi:hypothetical protein